MMSSLSIMEQMKLLQVAETGHGIHTIEDFKKWIAGPVKEYFPHEMMVCGLGQISGESIRIKHVIGINYPNEYLERFSKTTNLAEYRALQRWLLEYRAQVLNAKDIEPSLSAPEQQEFVKLGQSNIAAFGCIDVTGQGGTYFSFSRIPGTLTKRHAYMLELLVPYLHQALTRIYHRSRDDFQAPKEILKKLTERERQILNLMAMGMSNREIAETLSRSELTVQNHVHAILKKMGVPNRAAAVASLGNIS